MRWSVVAVGKLKEPFYREGTREYLGRLRRYRTVRVVEVADATVRPGREGDALREEARRIRQACGDARVVALTERGDALTTAQLARRLEALDGQGGDLAFVVGSANGLDPDFEREAAWRLALSALTLPHQLARLVLLEQLYRAESFRHGEPYHREGGPAR